MTGILATVILYNPSHEVLTNLKTYAPFVDHLLIVDNSESPHDVLRLIRQDFPTSYHISNSENLGIAKALNQSALYGIENNFRWLLTMDQDSKFEEGSFLKLINHKNSIGQVGIYTPVHLNKDSTKKWMEKEWTIVKKTMTSGNLLNLEAFIQCGSFEEKLFIDYVDHEYNLRLQKNGFKIVRINHSFLLHNLGDINSYRLGFISMKTTNHNELRRYYITRNRFFVIFKYFSFAPKFFFKEIREFWKSSWRILLLEKNKIQKFKAIISGTWDWMTNQYGKRNGFNSK